MDRSWNIQKIADKILEVVMWDIDKLSLQNMILHTQIKLRHATN